MATENQEGETLNGRLQLFLSSIFSSLGGVFSQGYHQEEEEEQEKDSEMASRVVVGQEQPRGGGKQKNGQQQAEGRTRRVLRDIGNLVPAPDGQQQISRPVTRSFKTQLLANAQKETEKNNKKKPPVPQPLPEVVNGIVARDNGGAAAAQKKDADKPNPEKVVMVAAKPDNGETECNNSGKNIKKSSKKPGKTLTSVLTARSEAVSGYVSSKPKKEMIVDIDAPDIDNELAVVEYIEDIYQFYKLTEEDGRVGNYMDSQPEINFKMRAILVDWLIEVHKKFELMPESLYLTVNIMDRYLSMKAVPRKQLQLVGISSMLIATKYEEIWAPEVSDFIAVSDNAYGRNQVLMTEKAILGKLGWYLTVPTPYVFLVRYTKASVPHDPEIEHMVFFFAELGLMDYSTTIKYCPSKLAASAVYAARCTLNKLPWWNETLKHHTGFSEDQVTGCAKLLVSFHSGAAENKLKGVYRKYSSPEWSSVALFPPATTLLSQSS